MEPGKSQDDFDTVLPPPGQPQAITCVAITSNFIITGSKQVAENHTLNQCSSIRDEPVN